MIPLVRYSFERIENEAKMRAEYLRLKAEVDRNAHCLVQLEAVVAYVQTDRFVEEWARERGRMALPGETLVVPYSSAPLVREAHPWWTDRVNCRE